MLKSLPEIKSSESAAPVESGNPSRFNVLRSLKQHPFLAGGIFLAILALGAPVAVLKSTHKFSSEVTIYVAPTFTKNVRGEQENYSQYSTFVSQQIASIERFDILAAAIRKTDGKPYAWTRKGETERETVERLEKSIAVRHIPDTYLISITLGGGTREGLAELLNALADVAVLNAADDAFFGRTDRVDTLNREKAQLEGDLVRMTTELSQYSEALGMVSVDKSSANPDDKLLINTRVDLDSARKARMEAETQYQAVAGQSEQSKSALGVAVTERLALDPSLSSTVNALNLKSAELRSSILGMTANHPSRKSVETQLTEIEEQLSAARNVARQRAEKQIVDKARADLDRARALEGQLDAQSRDRLKQVGGRSRELQSAVSLQSEIELTRTRLSNVKDRIDYLTVEGSAPGPLRVFSAAQRPLQPDSGTRKKLLLVVLGLALAASLGIVVGMDMLDQTVRDTNTVEQVFGFDPAGLILERRSFTKDFATEHFLRLVSGVERARQNFQARTFVFASVKPGGGTTKVVEDIARELKSRGLRVLKIEANAYRPDPRYVSSPQPPGLADILSGKCRPHEAVQHGGSLSPDWIHIGNTKGRPRLPGCHRFGAVLDQLASEYDVVLVDAAPLLLSSDTEAMVGLASATMLVVRANSDTTKDLKRANRLLRRLEPGAVGCILNRVELNRAGEALQQEFAEYTEFRKVARLPEASASAPELEINNELDGTSQKLLTRLKEDDVS